METLMLYFIVVVHIWTVLFNTCNSARLGPASAKFPAILVFGDSTVDTGNNNYIDTVVRANFLPYGQDYPDGPTGRFSNGKLVPDLLASVLKIKEAVPAFLDPKLSDQEIITGVCFASAGSGFDNQTNAATKIIPVLKQIDLFRKYIARLQGIVGEEKAKQIISGSLVIISAGTNDVAIIKEEDSEYQYFLLDRTQTFVKASTAVSLHFLQISNLSMNLQELYDLGCRTMIISGLPPVGCLPIQMAIARRNSSELRCLDDQNSYAQSFNRKLVKMLPQIQQMLSGSKIVYLDMYKTLIEMIDQPQKYGFVETKRGCCGTGVIELGFLCNRLTKTCEEASEYLFWDAIHPSLAAYQYIAKHVEDKIIHSLL
ncbi:hypothetical protein SADUNF_Sadunf10G0137200 [Salix dunnii]|uniref:Uncharacterized protein n=1 Tax=Salix dunnii TaxID=1413687 RepID=A0A835JNQ4_9ROSI|nr:hypothetical protein SADUNF_Sadunf10G0137200 [Salix dunnii]